MMEADAYSSFVSVDMEVLKPLFCVGLISSTQYADLDDELPAARVDTLAHLPPAVSTDGLAADAPAAASPHATADGVAAAQPVTPFIVVSDEHAQHVQGARRFRHGLEVLKRAVLYWREHRLAFIAHLGNVLASENAAAEAQWSALARYHEEAGRAECKQWHTTAGAHDLNCLGAAQLGALAPNRAGNGEGDVRHYAFSPSAGWRVVVLDAFDVSLLAHPPGSAAHSAALEMLARENPNSPEAADPLAGLGGVARRFGPRGGGIGPSQLEWLQQQLSAASEARERVLILCHLGCLPDACEPEALLFNYYEVAAVLEEHKGVVACVISGADGTGCYARDEHGVHHLTPCAAVRCEVNEDSFGVLQVYDDQLKLSMVGMPPSSKRRPQGWPESLPLPQSATLATAPFADGFAWSLLIVQMWLSFMHTLMSPMLRLLSSSSAAEASASDDAAASADAAVASRQKAQTRSSESSASAQPPPDGDEQA
uniref:Calcineurin-like phosphoesterase domain-containing protein n=1 Tax=Calcidiscus leptoporus TaxID=127549 RepID=A0A7S0J0L9_9EUKA